MIILYGGHGYELPSEATFCALGVCRANAFILSLTIEIPRSSDAFSSSTRSRKLSGLESDEKSHKHTEPIGANNARTQRAVATMQESWMSFLFLEGHRTTYEEAEKR